MDLCLGTPFAPSTTQNVTSSSETAATATTVSRQSNGEEEVPKLKVFTVSEIKSVTKNFRHDTIIGMGDSENVFKGWLDEKTLAPSKPGVGIKVTAKMFDSETEEALKEWQTELNFLGKLSHPNLVRILGYCCCEKKMMYLVYESMKHSLERHLFVICQLNAKCDVYNFGVVLLEILTGMRAFDTYRITDQQSLVGWVKSFMGSNIKFGKIIDRNIDGQYPLKDVLQMAQIALSCLEGHPTKRPPMKDVVEALEKIKK